VRQIAKIMAPPKVILSMSQIAKIMIPPKVTLSILTSHFTKHPISMVLF